METFPLALGDLGETRIRPTARNGALAVDPDQPRPGGCGRLGGSAERRMDDRDGGPGRDRDGGGPMRVGEPHPGQLGLAPAERRQRGLHPALEAALDDRHRLAVAEEHDARRELVRDRQRPGRPLSGRTPSRIVQSVHDRLERPDRLDHLRRHVLVDREDHDGVGAGRRPGQVHRADVHVRLAEHLPDPADRPGPVVVARDEHRLGGDHVEPVLVEPDEPGLAGRDGPADRRRRGRRTSPDKVSNDENWPASGVLRSTTVIPRALARAPALTRFTRSVVAVSSRPRRTAAVSGPTSNAASSPATSSVSVRTPPGRTGRRTVRAARPAAGRARWPGPSPG